MNPTRQLAARMPMMKLPAQVPVMARAAAAPRSAAERDAMHPLQDASNYFHGVGLNAPLVRKLWQEGILSQAEAQRRGVKLTQNFEGGYNGKKNISVSRFYGARFSYGEYSHGKLSIIIDGEKVEATSYPYGGFSDEHHVPTSIAPASFRGLLVPASKLDAPIASLEIGLTCGANACVHKTARAYVHGVREVTGQDVCTKAIEQALEAFAVLPFDTKLGPEGRDCGAAIEQALATFTARSYAPRLAKLDPTLQDVLRATLPKSVPCIADAPTA